MTDQQRVANLRSKHEFDPKTVNGSGIGRCVKIAGVNNNIQIGTILRQGFDGAPQDSLPAVAVIGEWVEESDRLFLLLLLAAIKMKTNRRITAEQIVSKVKDITPRFILPKSRPDSDEVDRGLASLQHEDGVGDARELN
uniref:Uncharacterized protein n=1 Tax=Kalanchoe fedtschenkoi TaxID=63787 RepID=A0A7N0T4K6_KALFE